MNPLSSMSSAITGSSYKRQLVIIEEDDYTELLEPYKNSEYIPNNIVEEVLFSCMPSAVIVHSYSDTHKIVKVKISDLLNAPVTNWNHNRPPDLKRCYDIARYVCYLRQSPDTMFYVSFNNKKQSFDILDGIHRYKSLKIIKEENNKSVESEFGHNNNASWLYDNYLFLNIRFNAREGELIELFKSLNKSVPVSELYIKDVSREKKTIIEDIVNDWQIKYYDHFSSKSKPNKPNVNRDSFMDLLGKVYDKYDITEENKHILEQLLNKTNNNISNTLPRKLSVKIIDKCSETGCWLFVYTCEQLLRMI
jgi:hypothetical protein